jgi:hypothetical protein|nr:MAG TPA: hypothetical protein [Caudoviricetes sp.]
MKKRQRLEILELLQEIDMLIDDWHFTKCPHDEAGSIYIKCQGCPNIELCRCLLKLSLIKLELSSTYGDLRK